MNPAMQMFDDLAELGLTVGEAVQVTDMLLSRKQANGPMVTGVSDLVKYAPGAVTGAAGLVKNVVGTSKSLLDASVPLVIAAGAIPGFAGYTVGHMLAGALDADSGDVAEIQEQELIREMNANAEALRRRNQMRAASAGNV